MSGGALAAGIVAGFGIAVPVGPVTVYLVGLAARTRFAVAAAAALGVATTDGAYALVAVAGGGELLPLMQPLAGSLSVLAAAALVALGAGVVRTAVRRYRAGPPSPVARRAQVSSPARAYAGFVILTALNPTTVVYFLALVVGQQGTGSISGSCGAAMLFVAGALLASAVWQLLLAGGSATLGRVATRPSVQLIIAVASGLIMLALALSILIQR